MKKGITTLVGCTLFTLLVAFSSGGKAESTGAPDEATCGNSSCHNTSANTGSAMLNLELTGATTTYDADATYTLKVSLADAQAAKNGFQIVALDEGNNNVGAWTITDAASMKEINGITLSDRKYVTHTGNGNQQSEWSFDWTAPSSDMGAITFYVSSIDANANGTKSGDNLYTTTSTLAFNTVSSLESLKLENIGLYPNPASEQIFLENIPTSITQIRVYDVRGALVQQSAYTNMLDVKELKEGLYFLQLQSEKGFSTKQFLVQR